MRNLFIVSVTLFLLTACGSDNSTIPFVGSNVVNPAPEVLTAKALDYASACYSGTMQKAGNNPCESDASSILREETIGMSLNATRTTTQDRYNVKISLHYSALHDVNYCSTVEYNVSESMRLSGTNQIDNLGEIRCLEYVTKTKQCKSLFIEINKTPSSVADRQGKVIEGTVFAILENRSQPTDSVQIFLPMDAGLEYFLFAKGQNLTCQKPSLPVIINSNDIIYSVDTTQSFGGTPSPYYDFSNTYF